jgi:death-on-curing protein
LSLAEVLYLHGEALKRFGGSPGVGELGLIESAVASAKNAYWYGHGDVYDVAAAYAFHIAESQAFTDGNKRTGAAAALLFLATNDVRAPKDDGSFYRALIDVAEKRLDKPGLAHVLRRLVQSVD